MHNHKASKGEIKLTLIPLFSAVLMIKSLFRLSLRMVTGFVQSLIKPCGINWTAPDYSTLCRRKKQIDIAINYQKSLQRLHLLIDSTGLKFLGDLLAQIPLDEQIDSVYTDGAYDTKECRQVIADRQAYAVIPPRKNAKAWKDNKTGSLERNKLIKTVKCLGRTLWKKMVWLSSSNFGLNYHVLHQIIRR